jgi:hypothetical protein
VRTFASVLSIPPESARFFLESARGDLQVAMNLFLDSGSARAGAAAATAGGGSGLGLGGGFGRGGYSLQGDGSSAYPSPAAAGGRDDEDAALAIAIALSQGGAVSDEASLRAMSAQLAAESEAEQSRARNPFAAFGQRPAGPGAAAGSGAPAAFAPASAPGAAAGSSTMDDA